MGRSSLFLFLFCAGSFTWAAEKSLAQDPYWLRLLHYRHDLFGRYQSEINDPSFFLAPNGRRDPEAELQATLAAFASPQVAAATAAQAAGEAEPQSAQCRYPARYAWLKEKLQLKTTDQACPRFERWRDQMNAESVSLIFASAFMNNPSSMYGHTFLRLNRKSQSTPQPLLDYAVNFAADLANDNGILFAIKGLTGNYQGHFSTMPFYMKVQEYNNLESRDLWEYQLNLSPAAIDRLLRHLWELGMSGQPYYFLNKNCSYYFLPLFEVVEPTFHLKDPFVFKAIPIDTVRMAMKQPGFVGSITRRLSLSSKLIEERRRLTDPEARLAERLVVIPAKAAPNRGLPLPMNKKERGGIQSWTPASAGVTTLESLPPERQAMVLDTAYTLFRYKVGFKQDSKKEIQEKDHQLLLLRNKIPTSSPSAPVGDPSVYLMDSPPTTAGNDDRQLPPHIAHATGRLQLSYGFSNHSHFEELSMRTAIHDQDDPPQGYLPGSRLEMFHLKLRYDNDRKTLYTQQFALIDMVSITPADSWIHPPSWKVNSGIGVAQDLKRDPENSLYYGLNLGSGYSAWMPGTKNTVLATGMAEMVLELGHAYSHDVRFGGGPSGGVLWTPVSYYRARMEGSYFPYAVGGTSSTTKLALYQSFSISKDFELRAKLERQNSYKEVLLSWVWFL